MELNIYVEWQEMPPDQPFNCTGCGELVVTAFYQQFVFVVDELIQTKFKYCETCYSLRDELEDEAEE